jgi:hypothetical protein
LVMYVPARFIRLLSFFKAFGKTIFWRVYVVYKWSDRFIFFMCFYVYTKFRYRWFYVYQIFLSVFVY